MTSEQAGSDGRIDVTVDSRPSAAGLSAIENRMLAFANFISRTSSMMSGSMAKFNSMIGGGSSGSGGGGGGALGLLARFGGTIGGVNPVIASFGKIISVAVGALSGFFAIKTIIGFLEQFISRTIEVNRVYTGFIASMSIVRGSVDAAKKEYEFLLAISNKLGVEVETSITQYHRLAAALKNVDTTGELTRHIFSGLSQAAVVLHSRGHDVTLIFEAVQQMASKGKLSLEELQRQLGNTLPGAMGIAARAMMESESFIRAGVKNAAESERMLRKGIQDGTINVYEFLLRLSNQLKKEYGTGVEYASNQFTANFNRMKNAVFEFYRMVGSSGAMEGLTNLIREVTALFNDGGNGAFGLGKAFGDVFNSLANWTKQLSADDISEFFTTVQTVILATKTVVEDFFNVFSRFSSSEIEHPLLSFVEFVAKTMAALVDIFAVAVAGIETVIRSFIAVFNDLRELIYTVPDMTLDLSEKLYNALPDGTPGIDRARQDTANRQAERRAREQARADNLARLDKSLNYFIFGPDQTSFDRVSNQFSEARAGLDAQRAANNPYTPWNNYGVLKPFNMTTYVPNNGRKAGSTADEAARYVNPLGDSDLQKILEQVRTNSGAPNQGTTAKTHRDPVENNFLREQTRLIKDYALAETEYQNVLANRNLTEGENVAQMRSLMSTDERYIKLSDDKKSKLMSLAKQLDDMKLRLENAKKSQEAYNQSLQAEFDVSSRLEELSKGGYESKYRKTTDVMNSFREGGSNQLMDEMNQQKMLSAAMREDAAQRNLDMARYAAEIRRSNEEMTFQTSLVGLSKFEVQKLTEFRKIDLQIQQMMVGATQSQQDEYLKLAEILKGDVADALQQVQDKQKDLWAGAKQGFQNYVDSVSDYSSQMADITTNAFSGMEDAFVKFVETGKLSFKDLTRSIAKDLAKLIIRYLIVWILQKMTGLGGGGGTSGFGGMESLNSSGAYTGMDAMGGSNLFPGSIGSAKGNVFMNGSVVPHAKGGVYNQPMMFPMSGGRVGTAFEKNAEAIMPLARDSSGNLGVKVADHASSGGESVLNLTVEVYQGKGDGVKTEQGQNEKGDVLKIFIGEVASDIQRGGKVGQAITQTYGISRKPRSYS